MSHHGITKNKSFKIILSSFWTGLPGWYILGKPHFSKIFNKSVVVSLGNKEKSKPDDSN